MKILKIDETFAWVLDDHPILGCSRRYGIRFMRKLRKGSPCEYDYAIDKEGKVWEINEKVEFGREQPKRRPDLDKMIKRIEREGEEVEDPILMLKYTGWESPIVYDDC